jgi:hypothetical protein
MYAGTTIDGEASLIRVDLGTQTDRASTRGHQTSVGRRGDRGGHQPSPWTRRCV